MNESRFFRQDADPSGQPRFTVLYKLRKMGGPWRRFFFNRFLTRDSPPPEPAEDEMYV